MWLAESCDHRGGGGGRTPIVNTVHIHQLYIVKTGRIALFLAAGFARVAIKKLLLSGVPHRIYPHVLHILFHALILAPAFSPH